MQSFADVLPIDIDNISNVAQLGIIVAAAVWSIAKVSTTANVLKALVERMEKQMLRLQADNGRIERRVSRLEGMARAKPWDQDSPTGGDEGE